MVLIVGYEPVDDLLKERKTFHLRETTKVDIRTLLLHILHALIALFQLFHPTFFLVRVKNVVQSVFLYLFHTVASQL